MPGEDDLGEFASPPCLLHEVDPAYSGLPAASDRRQQTDVARWRKAERERLYAVRRAIDPETRRLHAAAIALHLDRLLGDPRGLVVAAYWPIRGEPDLRSWAMGLAARGATAALPVVVEQKAPLEFHLWRPDAKLEAGIWNIPIPAERAPVVPDVILSPVLGFDAAFYRLGNGGGYFDRTLAALATPRQVIGIGYDALEIPTIYPQPYDIAMDLMVTESGARQSRKQA